MASVQIEDFAEFSAIDDASDNDLFVSSIQWRTSMKFTVSDLNRVGSTVRALGTREGKSLSAMLHRGHPEFCQILDEVGMDPRCIEASRFCTMFCALALQHARAVTRRQFVGLPVDEFWEWARRLSTGRGVRIGDRARGYRRRIRRHALGIGEFDEDDADWLCTTISAFLLIVEESS